MFEGKTALEISKLCPPDINDHGTFFKIWWASHCLVYWNKGNWKFLNHLERTWFQNPDDVHSIVFVKQSADLHYQRVTDIMLEKFLKG